MTSNATDHRSAGGPDSSPPAEVPAVPGAAPTRGNNVDDIVIGAGVVSTGTFVTRGMICVDGTLRDSVLEADVISISRGADFQGRAQARHVEVFGRIEGELVATEQLVLRASAHVTGRISSPCMVIHRGATVTGEVESLGFDASRISTASAASARDVAAVD